MSLNKISTVATEANTITTTYEASKRVVRVKSIFVATQASDKNDLYELVMPAFLEDIQKMIEAQ